MEPRKTKVSIPFLIVGSFFSAIIGYFINGAWHKGIEFTEFMQNLEAELSYPFNDYYNETTIKAVIYSLIIFAIVMLMYYTSRRNLMPGKEYGTAHFATVKEINRELKSDGTKEDKKKEKKKEKGPRRDFRILSENIRMNMDNRFTGFNNNIFAVGGSGAGKTRGLIKPIILNCSGSYIVTDPKQDIISSVGTMLKNNGYVVKCLNLIDMRKSFHYDPFVYIKNENDIQRLVGNIIQNTTPKNATQNDPFWEKAETMYLTSIFLYAWMVPDKKHRNMRFVMKLLKEAEVKKDQPSELDKRMMALAESDPLHADHPAYKMYQKVVRGAGDTVRSIIISANARLAKLDNDEVLSMMDYDEMNLEELGIGVNGDEQTKTALFCVIPDSDKTYNFIVGMLYTQAFQHLYRIADEVYDGQLPIHVSFLLDEFANVALPDDFCSLISTMRSRSISAVCVLQNLAQLKAMYKDTWETVTGNCDTCIYLGGNEQGTHEYMSKLLGKQTIDKRSSGETRGRQGSSSRNYDVLGRDLMTPDEVGRLSRRKCIIKISGLPPIIDNKYNIVKHPRYKETSDGKGEPYVMKSRKNETTIGAPFDILGEKSLAYYQKKMERDKSEKISIVDVTLEEFMMLDEFTYGSWFRKAEDKQVLNHINEEEGMGGSLQFPPADEGDDEMNEMAIIHPEHTARYEHPGVKKQGLIKSEPKPEQTMETIKDRLANYEFSYEQQQEILRAIEEQIPEDYILSYAYPENSTIKLATFRTTYTGQSMSA